MLRGEAKAPVLGNSEGGGYFLFGLCYRNAICCSEEGGDLSRSFSSFRRLTSASREAILFLH